MEEQKRTPKVLTKEKADLQELEALQKRTGLAVVTRSYDRVDGRLKVTGKLAFGGDYPQEGFLHGKILRSPYPHALIKAVRTEKARALPGVAAVLTAKDVPGRNGFGVVIPDQPVICGEKVRVVGDGVALVAAETEEIAQRALGLIEIDYEPLPAVFDPVEAMKPGAPAIHGKSNLISRNNLIKGDTEKGFAEADVILERTYKVPFVEHGYLEPDIVMAIPRPDGVMLVQGPMQAPFTTRHNIAPVLGVPLSQVQVKSITMGGGFGGKEDSPIDIGCRAAVLAAHTKRPVRIALEREEVTIQTGKRHPLTMRIRIGAKRDGTLVAFDGTIHNEQGAYASLGPVIPPAGGVHIHAMVMMPGPYEIPNCRVEAYLVYTNHPYCGAMRGFGAPQVCFAHESIMDELAGELGMNPIDLRRKNAFRKGSKTATSQVLDQSVGLRETLEACARTFNWDRRYREAGYVDKEKTKRRGVGLAMGWYRTSIGLTSDGCGTNIHVHGDGSALVYIGITEMGQGAFTVFSQICAEALGILPEDVRIVQPDTDFVPESGPTVGSRSTVLMGNAILEAAKPIRESIFAVASQMLSVPVERLEAKSRLVFDREHPDHAVPFKAVAARCAATGKRLIGQGWWTPPPSTLDPETAQGNPYHVFTYSTQMAEVVVDVQTGEVEVTDMVAAFDVGRALNPRAVEGQIEGGVAMGLGYALMEEIIVKDGIIQNPNLQDFLIPTTLDVPNIRSVILEEENIYGPYGAKGIGEMPNIPAAPTITNAIAHACGGRVYSLPADPEKVFKAIQAAGGPPKE